MLFSLKKKESVSVCLATSFSVALFYVCVYVCVCVCAFRETRKCASLVSLVAAAGVTAMDSQTTLAVQSIQSMLDPQSVAEVPGKTWAKCETVITHAKRTPLLSEKFQLSTTQKHCKAQPDTRNVNPYL